MANESDKIAYNIVDDPQKYNEMVSMALPIMNACIDQVNSMMYGWCSHMTENKPAAFAGIEGKDEDFQLALQAVLACLFSLYITNSCQVKFGGILHNLRINYQRSNEISKEMYDAMREMKNVTVN